MAMLQATLKSELVDMDLYSDEPSAVLAWVGAWSTYFSDAETNGIPIQAGALAVAEAAMQAAMSGLSGEGAGAGKIQSGIQAWWNAIVAASATFWPGCTAVAPPTGLSGIQSGLQSVFDANTIGSLSEAAAYDAIADVLHPSNLGGLATFPGPLVFPIL